MDPLGLGIVRVSCNEVDATPQLAELGDKVVGQNLGMSGG